MHGIKLSPRVCCGLSQRGNVLPNPTLHRSGPRLLKLMSGAAASFLRATPSEYSMKKINFEEAPRNLVRLMSEVISLRNQLAKIEARRVQIAARATSQSIAKNRRMHANGQSNRVDRRRLRHSKNFASATANEATGGTKPTTK